MTKELQLPANSTAKQEIPREEYTKHPEFGKRIGEALVNVETPKDKIPQDFSKWLHAALTNIPIGVLGSADGVMPLPIYMQFIESQPEDMSFGVLQKASRIILSSKPNDYREVAMSNKDTLLQYHHIVTECGNLIDAMSDITNPIREKVIDDIIASENLKKAQAKFKA